MSLGLGDINAAVLNGIADKLAGVVANLGPEETAVVNSEIEHFQAMGSALEEKTMADLFANVKAAETPVLDRLDRLIGVAEKFEGFSNGFDISVTPKKPVASNP